MWWVIQRGEKERAKRNKKRNEEISVVRKFNSVQFRNEGLEISDYLLLCIRSLFFSLPHSLTHSLTQSEREGVPLLSPELIHDEFI